ncbi:MULTISPECIES: response regulator [Herpetosiphon]|uniref:Response regulatory domain-containing protein n=1 Tax=Herpetosiphon geysericola TaxID=70996 RepID=A0A0P6YIL4_9CHLR|nr:MULTISPECIES: response regulator [Herpetosiphon]KPL90387.1 hypothetical protein SE18_07210 [Herpetosiphon geysericola]MBM7846167.1 CheY-like chemotaxis protein [Herpetosiphon giganteus]
MPTILVVDDMPDNRQLLGIMLQRSGYTTEMARDGVEALEAIQKSQPDLVLLDLNLPRMDGWTVCRTVKASPHLAHIPIVALTASCSPGEVKQLMTPDWTDYVSKPFDVMSLMEKVKLWLAGSNQSKPWYS